MKVNLVVNPIAGNRAYRYINRIQNSLKKKVSLDTLVTKKKGDAFEFARNLNGSDLIIIASGDGTINEVVNGILTSTNSRTPESPIALIPMGISNVLAKELGIPHNVERAIKLAIDGKVKKISLGRINGKYFTLMAGVGFDGETVYRLKNNMIKKISGKAAHVVSGLKVLSRYKPSLIRIKTGDSEVCGYSAIASNAKCYGGYFSVAPMAAITDPVLDVCVFMGRRRRDIARYIKGVILKNGLKYDDITYIKSTELEITSDDAVHVQVDGDYFGTLPVKIDVIGNALNVIC